MCPEKVPAFIFKQKRGLYSKRKKELRLLYHIKAVFLAPDGATEKHG